MSPASNGHSPPNDERHPLRKVQWASTATAREIPSRELDEDGLDPQAFSELANALERHQSLRGFHSHPRVQPSLSTSASDSGQATPYDDISESQPLQVYVPPEETAGLPGDARPSAAANSLVKAHRKGISGLFSFRKTPKDEPSHAPQDEEKRIGGSQPNVRAPTGVLSSLLSLYDNTRSGMSSSRSSLDESLPISTLSPSIPTEGHCERDEGLPHTSSRRPVTNSSANTSLSDLLTPLSPARPAAARSQAGVFGGLIAATSNIQGAAAPAASQVTVNPKRPGYHLTRYSLDSALPKNMHSPSSTSPPSHVQVSHADYIDVEPPPPKWSYSRRFSAPHLTKIVNRKAQKDASHVTKTVKNAISSLPGSRYTTPEKEFDETAVWSQGGKRKRKRRKQDIFITRHVAQIIERQQFVCKLARSFMMFGAPSHRLQAQLYALANVLEIELACLYLPDVMLISFGDSATATSNLQFIRQSSSLDLGKLQEAYDLYWKVIHDKMPVSEASVELDHLMKRPAKYRNLATVMVGGLCSSFICTVSFNGSFIDALASFPLGCLLVLVQHLSAQNELYSNVFEWTIATILSFIAAALSTFEHFCYTAIASSAVVLILPGYIVLVGSLELSSRNIVSGAVRLCFAIMYSLFLGFGLSIGSSVMSSISGRPVIGADDLLCRVSHHSHGAWYQRTAPVWWAFLTVPGYSFFLSLRNQAPLKHRELYLSILISAAGWTANHFSGLGFPNRSDITAAIGAFSVGLISNLYARFFEDGNAFVLMITGILFQLPSGLANGGLFTFAQANADASADMSATSDTTGSSYRAGFEVALQLVSVSVGLTVGLAISLVVVHPIASRKRAGGLFSL